MTSLHWSDTDTFKCWCICVAQVGVRMNVLLVYPTVLTSLTRIGKVVDCTFNQLYVDVANCVPTSSNLEKVAGILVHYNTTNTLCVGRFGNNRQKRRWSTQQNLHASCVCSSKLDLHRIPMQYGRHTRQVLFVLADDCSTEMCEQNRDILVIAIPTGKTYVSPNRHGFVLVMAGRCCSSWLKHKRIRGGENKKTKWERIE